jgi:hypothetical protein
MAKRPLIHDDKTDPPNVYRDQDTGESFHAASLRWEDGPDTWLTGTGFAIAPNDERYPCGRDAWEMFVAPWQGVQ